MSGAKYYPLRSEYNSSEDYQKALEDFCLSCYNSSDDSNISNISNNNNQTSVGTTTANSERKLFPKSKLVPKESWFQVPCLKGLKNHGNTDYFNALMQCLAGCDRLAEFLLCNDFVEYNKNIIFNSFVNTIRCMWFNNTFVDEFCHKAIRSISNENSTFCLGSQHDSHECLIWLLNRLDQEILDSNLEKFYSKDSSFDSYIKIIRDNENNKKEPKSTILKLFQGQFRHEIKCTTPNCDFVDISTEPFLSVSLSVPLPRKYTVKFISMTPRKITRFHLNISEPYLTVRDIMEQIEKVVKVSPEYVCL
uniref:ubiquitinyl hydrolase 1 n=1 Tax=Meloidogyne enterolobii TaxID=390850 RepID=A0A6V7VMI8_MELEN|nr:unnamed protein product [Meloidogyne enterolobii]